MSELSSSFTKPQALICSPLALLAFVLVLLCVLLSLPLVIPIGPMYWDTCIYLDAAQRIKLGQIPAVDFLAPVGAQDYYQFYWLQTLFPDGQPTLLAQWSVLISALMAIIVAAIDRHSRKVAFAVLIPFIIFSLCPTNAQSFHSYPGVNGFGIYNRHTSLLLYALTSALAFLPNSRKLAVVAALTMRALFLTKITGFLAGISRCGNDINGKHNAESPMQLRGEQPGKDEQTAGHFKTKGYGKCPAGKGPVLLAYMLTVERQIKEVIDDIDCRSRRRKCEKSNDRIAQYGPVHDLVIEYGRNENQRVLHPLMRAAS